MGNAEHTRELLLSRAGALFNTVGYETTSLQDITKATGLTKGAIYGHFENKAGLEVASFEYLAEQVFAEIRTVVRAQPDAPRKLEAIMDYYRNYLDDSPVEGGCPLLNAAIYADDALPHLRAAVRASYKTLQHSLEHIISQGVERGQLKPTIDGPAQARLIITGLEGALMLSKIMDATAPLYTMIDHLKGQLRAYYS